jgi:hypothetical protein
VTNGDEALGSLRYDISRHPLSISFSSHPTARAVTSTADHDGQESRAAGRSRAYQAQTWRQARRVIIKAEVVAHPGRDLRDNPRFLVTNLRHTPETVDADIYAARADSGDRIK